LSTNSGSVRRTEALVGEAVRLSCPTKGQAVGPADVLQEEAKEKRGKSSARGRSRRSPGLLEGSTGGKWKRTGPPKGRAATKRVPCLISPAPVGHGVDLSIQAGRGPKAIQGEVARKGAFQDPHDLRAIGLALWTKLKKNASEKDRP